MKLMPALFCLCLPFQQTQAQNAERAVTAEIIVDAGAADVWRAWTTAAGIKTFFAPGCNVDLKPMGAYEILFNPGGAAGERGAEGCVLLALQPEKMLAFTWNAPPHLPNVRQQFTSVVVRFKALDANRTHVTLRETGWGEGEEWDAAFNYFSKAWQGVVFARLKHRFEHGPIDWANPPKFPEQSN